MNNLTTLHEIAEKLVHDNICTLNSEDFNENYDETLSYIKSVINDYVVDVVMLNRFK
nr:MAG TPA: hypothetical protein [Caudoviricetes sp.]